MAGAGTGRGGTGGDATACARLSCAASATRGLSLSLASTERISSISLAMSCSATSRAAAIMFITTTAPRCCSSALGLSSRACRISSQCTVCREMGPTSTQTLRGGSQLPSHSCISESG
uniref:Uncharacterized protein n=1 Tax=Malurus cyaneus samueli TaxID=2593467 RepID=A0A8C5TWY8_9PASS